MPRIPSPYQTVMATRPLLDWIVRQHLAAFPNLSIRESSEVIGLLPLGGVRIRTRDGNQTEYTMPASLVVDTSGRDARAPQWFEGLGYLPPTDTIINSFLGYATRMYEPPADWQADWKSIFIMFIY